MSVTKDQLTTLRKRMRTTNVVFHLVRNNPRHREQYYFALIAMVGYENWKNVDPTLRMNWESARLSFDRMYGMVKDFAEHAEEYETAFLPVPQENKKVPVEKMQKSLNKIYYQNSVFADNLKNLSYDTNKKFEVLKALLPPQDKIKELRDALNEWIPPENEADKK